MFKLINLNIKMKENKQTNNKTKPNLTGEVKKQQAYTMKVSQIYVQNQHSKTKEIISRKILKDHMQKSLQRNNIIIITMISKGILAVTLEY